MAVESGNRLSDGFPDPACGRREVAGARPTAASASKNGYPVCGRRRADADGGLAAEQPPSGAAAGHRTAGAGAHVGGCGERVTVDVIIECNIIGGVR
ncbi:MAG TPA: hypothetical protein VHN78_14725 [Chloroflexota bacterium]|nr:hypothetical protein [Chloroflexota bacterium]